jgi:hypothetical protein
MMNTMTVASAQGFEQWLCARDLLGIETEEKMREFGAYTARGRGIGRRGRGERLQMCLTGLLTVLSAGKTKVGGDALPASEGKK